MYPRLKLSQKLLTDDGVIFVSIDDNEQANLKLLMDDIFGEGNFITTFIWKKTENIKMDSKFVSDNKDYVVCYRKNSLQKFNKDFSNENRFNLFDEKGKYYLRKLDSLSSSYSKSMDYIIEHEGKRYYAGGSYEKFLERQEKGGNKKDAIWLWSKQKYEEGLKENEIVFKSGNVYNKVRYTGEAKKPFTDFIVADSGQSSQTDLNDLFDKRRVFDHPKPVNLITWLYKLIGIESNDDIILDFFVGSATTAHAVMQLNAEDLANGKEANRKFIMVQLDEPTNPDSEARKAGYKTIDEISRERIKRAAKKLSEPRFSQDLQDKQDLFSQNQNLDNPENLTKILVQDTGFKHYRLITPNAQTIDKITEFNPNENRLFSEDIISELGGLETLLATWLIDDGYTFDQQPQEIDFVGYKAYYIDNSLLYIINAGWEHKQTEALLNLIGKNELNVNTIIVYGYSFTMESLRELKLNVKNNLNRQVSIEIRY